MTIAHSFSLTVSSHAQPTVLNLSIQLQCAFSTATNSFCVAIGYTPCCSLWSTFQQHCTHCRPTSCCRPTCGSRCCCRFERTQGCCGASYFDYDRGSGYGETEKRGVFRRPKHTVQQDQESRTRVLPIYIKWRQRLFTWINCT